MKTELNKLIDTCAQSLMAWIKQNDLTDETSGIIITVFFIAGLFMIGLALTPARKSS